MTAARRLTLGVLGVFALVTLGALLFNAPAQAQYGNGSGSGGGNGSIHWSMNTNGSTVSGRDPIDVREAGRSKGHPGEFRLTLRYDSYGAAQAALAEHEIREVDGKYFVTVDVPIIPRETISENLPLEWRVDW